MAENYRYLTLLEPKFGSLELIDERGTSDARQPWYNETLCKVNDSVVRLAVVEGDYHWHSHTHEDEFFYVVEGLLLVDYIDPAVPGASEQDCSTIRLEPRQGVVMPKTVRHRPRAPERTVMLMMEPATITPTGS